MNPSKPVVYLIDDEDQSSAAAELAQLGVEAEYLYPTEVTGEHLVKATLLAVDEFFNLREPAPNEDWDVPSDLPPALVPADGLALAAVLRSAAHKTEGRTTRLGITLRTGDLDRLSQGLPRGIRQPLVAAQHDIEWAISKVSDVGAASTSKQIASLAFALHDYPSSWDSGSPSDVGIGWIEVPDAEWAGDARTHILACRPPANTTTTTAHGLSWLRWLAHRALPYPSFVVADAYAAALVGVTAESFRTVAEDLSSPAGRQLAAIRYQGPLADLYTTRYWRAGLTRLARSVVSDDLEADEPTLVGAALAEKFTGFAPLEPEHPVVAIDEDYFPLDQPIERSEAIRLAPDGWPPFADPAWARQEAVAEPGMARLVAPQLK